MLGVIRQFVMTGVLIGLTVMEIRAQKTSGSSFSCNGRNAGYYADVSTGCQVYHMCDGLGRQFSYKCPSKTLFQQRMLICDHWYMVNCSKAEQDYGANLLIGQQGKPFVEDLEYSRTPRPDLVDPNNADFSTYRLGKGIPESAKTFEGSSENTGSSSNFDERGSFTVHNQVTESYSEVNPVQYKRQESGTGIQGLNRQIFYRTSYDTANRNVNEAPGPKGKGISFDSAYRKDNEFNVNASPRPFTNKDSTDTKQTNDQSKIGTNQNNVSPSVVNFPSNFKATTPVYPKHVDVDQSKFFEFTDPLQERSKSEGEVNFPSNFKATTPVYPQRVDTDPSKLSEFDIPALEEDLNIPLVNFPSKFKATTPIYPKYVDVDLKKFTDFAEEPPQTSEEVVAVNFASNFKATTPVYPKQVDVDLRKFTEFAEEPPRASIDEVVINFASNFKATTPVYPKEVDVDLSKFSEPVELPLDDRKNDSVSTQTTQPVSSISLSTDLLPPLSSQQSVAGTIQGKDGSSFANFVSNFEATTPNYPKSVEPTSPDPSEVGLLAPFENAQLNSQNGQNLDLDLFSKTFNRRIDEEDPLVLGNTFNSKQLTEFMLTMKPEQLKTLKNMWHIPDYDFPLENVSGPNYESELSSFQAKTSRKR